jgi:ribonuclease E
VVDGNKVEEFDFESENKRQLAGNIYLAKVTRVEPSLQAAFVDYGGNRHGFLAFSEIHPDYYQIPLADREALLAEEAAYAKQLAEEEDQEKPKRRSRGGRRKAKPKAAEATSDDAVETKEVEGEINGMDVVDLDTDDDAPALVDDSVAAPQPEISEDQPAEASSDDKDDEEPYKAVDDAAERDENIESVADDDDVEDIRPKRKPRPRKYRIQEVIKVRQVLLVQVVKEERGNKGAALTTYLSLAGRYCVLMPNTARGGGISRKITNAADRKKLKEIAGEIEVPQGAGLIVRTAGAKRTKSEIKRDYEYLQRMWEEIRELTLKSIAPAQIYEEGNLIKRSIRDLYNRDIDEVFVEGEEGYRVAKDFMKMIMPSHAKNVKLYNEGMPLFARYQVESYLAGMFNPTVQLKSGGYIVIGITEALVAIDVNSGRATKEGSIEDTATKTNLEAAEEVARQLRLRDLAGLIVIDFIDMEERKNNSAVEKRFKDKLKTDRARIQVGRISGFGLMEMSRQRLRPGMLEATTQPCAACHGTGLVRSDDSLGLTILRSLEEEGVRRRSKEVLIKAPITITNFLMNHKREHIAHIEARYGMAVRIECDPAMISPDFTLEKFKTATRVVQASTPVVSVDAARMPELEEEDVAVIDAEAPEGDGEQQPKKRRRRRRRRRGGGGGEGQDGNQRQDGPGGDAQAADAAPAEAPEVIQADGDATPAETEDKPKKRTRSRRKKTDETAADAAPEETVAEAPEAPETVSEEAPKPKRTRKRATKAKEETADEAKADASEAETEEKPAPKKRPRTRKKKVEEVADAPPADPAPAPAPEPAAKEPAMAEAAPEPKVEKTPEPDKPKKKGWWSFGS